MAIGELADGLVVDLDKVPKKYAGLDGTEIAISESQERMAVVVDPKDVDAVSGICNRRKPGGNRGCSCNRGTETGSDTGEEKRSLIFPVHSWIQTVLIRKQM